MLSNADVRLTELLGGSGAEQQLVGEVESLKEFLLLLPPAPGLLLPDGAKGGGGGGVEEE